MEALGEKKIGHEVNSGAPELTDTPALDPEKDYLILGAMKHTKYPAQMAAVESIYRGLYRGPNALMKRIVSASTEAGVDTKSYTPLAAMVKFLQRDFGWLSSLESKVMAALDPETSRGKSIKTEELNTLILSYKKNSERISLNSENYIRACEAKNLPVGPLVLKPEQRIRDGETRVLPMAPDVPDGETTIVLGEVNTDGLIPPNPEPDTDSPKPPIVPKGVKEPTLGEQMQTYLQVAKEYETELTRLIAVMNQRGQFGQQTEAQLTAANRLEPVERQYDKLYQSIEGQWEYQRGVSPRHVELMRLRQRLDRPSRFWRRKAPWFPAVKTSLLAATLAAWPTATDNHTPTQPTEGSVAAVGGEYQPIQSPYQPDILLDPRVDQEIGTLPSLEPEPIQRIPDIGERANSQPGEPEANGVRPVDTGVLLNPTQDQINRDNPTTEATGDARPQPEVSSLGVYMENPWTEAIVAPPLSDLNPPVADGVGQRPIQANNTNNPFAGGNNFAVKPAAEVIGSVVGQFNVPNYPSQITSTEQLVVDSVPEPIPGLSGPARAEAMDQSLQSPIEPMLPQLETVSPDYRVEVGSLGVEVEFVKIVDDLRTHYPLVPDRVAQRLRQEIIADFIANPHLIGLENAHEVDAANNLVDLTTVVGFYVERMAGVNAALVSGEEIVPAVGSNLTSEFEKYFAVELAALSAIDRAALVADFIDSLRQEPEVLRSLGVYSGNIDHIHDDELIRFGVLQPRVERAISGERTAVVPGSEQVILPAGPVVEGPDLVITPAVSEAPAIIGAATGGGEVADIMPDEAEVIAPLLESNMVAPETIIAPEKAAAAYIDLIAERFGVDLTVKPSWFGNIFDTVADVKREQFRALENITWRQLRKIATETNPDNERTRQLAELGISNDELNTVMELYDKYNVAFVDEATMKTILATIASNS